MQAPQLGIDPEDLGFDIIPAIEKSFGFKFTQADLADVRTYGELRTAVQAKLPSAVATDCTTQQAFYKLRQAIALHTNVQTITPSTGLANILPARGAQRRAVATAVEQGLGMKLPLLDMSPAVAGAGTLLAVLSLPILLISSLVLGARGALLGVGSFIAAIVVFNLGSRFGTTLCYTTVRDVVLAMSSQHYQQSRRDPATVNAREVNECLANLFVAMAGVELTDLTPDAVL